MRRLRRLPADRQVRTDDKWGNIYDHFSVVYEYPNGVRLFAQCRQIPGCSVDVSDHLWGTKGSAEMMKAPSSWGCGDSGTGSSFTGVEESFSSVSDILFSCLQLGSVVPGLFLACK